MAKKLCLLSLLAFIQWSCSDNLKVAEPAYLQIDEILLETNYELEGTSASKFVIAFIEVNGIPLGTFELPANIPVLEDGPTTITVLPGIYQNGIFALPTPFPFVNEIEEIIDLKPGETHFLNAAQDSIPRTKYRSTATVIPIEDFDGVGLTIAPSSRSDTNLLRVTDPLLIFPAPPGEVNIGSGFAEIPGRPSVFEIVTNNTYNFPRQGASVYVEMNYKTDITLVVGIIANVFGAPVQAPVVNLNPNSEWNKVYINLNVEVSAYNALDYRVFIGALSNSDVAGRQLFLDNIKVVF
ncbi:MAG: hypothetical protein LAT76_02890 [Schleiferiaceae bacterium]|nr:hypothetical protein [Schleiferiaceae bacterium]